MRFPFLIWLILLGIQANTHAYDRSLWTSYPSMNEVVSLAESTEAIYVATTGGIRRYDRFAHKWMPPLTQLDGLPANRIQRMIFDPQTRELWFDTPAGSGRWSEGLQTVFLGGAPPNPPSRPTPHFSLSSLVPPFGYYVDPNRIMGPRQSYPITQMLVDSWNNLWIGTYGLGVGRANLNDRLLKFDTYGPIEENVTALALDKQSLWIGGDNTIQAPSRGISRFDLDTQEWTYFQPNHIIGLENAQIMTILPDSNQVWFGTHSGLTRYSKNQNRWLTYRDTERWGRIQGLAKDRNTLWIGSERGLAYLNTKTDTLGRVSGSENAIIYDLKSGPENIWAGTEGGLYHCTRNTRTWRAVSAPHNYAKRVIRALTIHDSTLWMATEYPSGIIRHHIPSNSWDEFSLSEIGGTQHISISANDKHVWVSTPQGAFLLDIDRHLWTRYHTTEGLIDGRVQAILLNKNEVWFGTAGGLSQYRWSRDFLVD